MLRCIFILFFAVLYMPAHGFAEQGNVSVLNVPKKPYEILLKFYDENERAITYHRYCVDRTVFPPGQFVYNADYVSLQLRNEMIKAFPDKTQAQIEDFLLKRGRYQQRKNTQIAFDQGCYGAWAKVAKAHYDMFTDMETDVIERFVENRLRRE